MQMHGRVELTPEELISTIAFGKLLYENKVKKKTLVAPIDKHRSMEELDIIGITAEFATAKFLGLPYAMELFDVSDECDLQVNGIKLEVKSAKYSDGELRIPKWQINKQVHAYVMTRMITRNMHVWDVVGFIPKSEFLNQMKVMTFKGYEANPMYVVPDTDLHSSVWLKQYLCM